MTVVSELLDHHIIAIVGREPRSLQWDDGSRAQADIYAMSARAAGSERAAGNLVK